MVFISSYHHPHLKSKINTIKEKIIYTERMLSTNLHDLYFKQEGQKKTLRTKEWKFWWENLKISAGTWNKFSENTNETEKITSIKSWKISTPKWYDLLWTGHWGKNQPGPWGGNFELKINGKTKWVHQMQNPPSEPLPHTQSNVISYTLYMCTSSGVWRKTFSFDKDIGSQDTDFKSAILQTMTFGEDIMFTGDHPILRSSTHHQNEQIPEFYTFDTNDDKQSILVVISNYIPKTQRTLKTDHTTKPQVYHAPSVESRFSTDNKNNITKPTSLEKNLDIHKIMSEQRMQIFGGFSWPTSNKGE